MIVVVSVSRARTRDYDAMYTPERQARAHPPAAHHHRHSRPHHHRYGEHSPAARQPHSNGLCSPRKEGKGPGPALRHVDAGPSTKRSDVRIVPNDTPAKSASHLSPTPMVSCRPGEEHTAGWPLHDIVMTNLVWCMAYKREVEKVCYTAQWPGNSIVTVWPIQMGG